MDNEPQLQRSMPARLKSWLTLRRLLLILAWTATLLVLFYAEENWRGRRAWNKHRQELEARGIPTDFKALLPKPVPDDQNFAATPVVQSWFDKKTFADTDQRWNDAYARAVGKVSASRLNEDATETLNKSAAAPKAGARQLTDLSAWAAAMESDPAAQTNSAAASSSKADSASRSNAALAVLEGLKTSEPILAELRSASRRPYSVYPVDYTREDPWAILIPHLANVKAACQRLQLKASAELALGRSAAALEDITLALYLADSVKQEPFVISYLVRLACVQIAVQAIWEGLAEQRWAELELRQLQSRLAEYDFIADLKHPLVAEHAAGVLTVDLIRQKGIGYLFALASPDGAGTPTPAATIASWLIPSGWYDHEKANYSRVFQMQQQGLTAAGAKGRVSPGRVEAASRALETELGGTNRGLTAIVNHRVIAGLLLPALGHLSSKAAAAQTAVEQSAIACALERYKIARGSYPEKLDRLVPDFIPRLPSDPMTGEPYIFRLGGDRFLLYSVGWNERDDGGEPGRNPFDVNNGDWVWTYPAGA